MVFFKVNLIRVTLSDLSLKRKALVIRLLADPKLDVVKNFAQYFGVFADYSQSSLPSTPKFHTDPLTF